MDCSRKVILSGVPDNCKLKEIKAEIVDSLKASRDCITKIKKCKTADGQIIPGKLEIEFASKDEVDQLLKLAVLEVEYDDELNVMRITRCRPTTSFSSLNQLQPTPTSTPPPVVREEERPPAIPGSNNCPQLPAPTASKFESKSDFFGWGSSDSSDDEFERVVRNPTSLRQTSAKDLPRSSQDFMQRSRRSELDVPENYQPLSPSRSQSKQQQQVQLPTKQTNFFELLQSHPDLFETYNDSGVLAPVDTNNPSEAECLLEYFGTCSRYLPINAFLLNDGLFLIYEDSAAAKAIVEKQHFIKQELIEFYLKPIPPIYKDRVLVKGNFAKNATDEVKQILSTCSDAHFKVKKLRECDMFLVVFDRNIDVDMIQKKVKKLHLKEMKPHVVKVCKTDCIRIQNVKESVPEYYIKIALMNKVLTKGEVTHVERCETSKKIAYVYYANYTDAETLLQSSKHQEVKVQQMPVDVTLYWNGIKGSVEFSANSIFQFFFPLNDVDSDIVTFVLKSRQQHMAEFHKELGDLAQVEIIPDLEANIHSVKIKPLLTPEQSQEMEQEKFESQCKSRIIRFFRKFQTDSRRFPLEDKERVRETYKWNDVESYVVQEIKKDETVKVLARWEDEKDRETVKVAGLPLHTRLFLDWFDVQCKHTTILEEFDGPNFDILVNCGILEEMKEVFKETIDIEVKKVLKSLYIAGPRETVTATLSTIKSNVKRTQDHDVSFLNKAQQEFLARTFQNKTRCNEIIEFIQDRFKSLEIKVSLQLQGSNLKLIYATHRKMELQRAEEELRSLLKFQIIPIDSGYDEIMEEDDWKTLKSKVEASGKLCILPNRSASSITLVGLPLSFSNELEKITAYMEENIEIGMLVEMTFSQAMFFSNFPKEVGVEKAVPESVEWFKEEGGIHVKGRACQVRKVKKWITTAIAKIVTQSKEFAIPGLNDYLRSQSGDQFLQTTAKDYTCFIKLDSADNPKWLEARKKARQGKTEAPYEVISEAAPLYEEDESVKEKSIFGLIGEKVGSWFQSAEEKAPTLQQMDAVKVKVVQGDILNSNCEVMINTTGHEFNLTLSRVSQALIKQSGQEMIQECANNPIVHSEMMRVTKAPNLTFQYVIHLVSPHSSSKITEHLLQALLIADTKLKCRSIAVPAIGTGQIDLSNDKVAKNVRKAIDRFRKSDPKFLTQIDVVIYEQRMLGAFQNALTGSGSVTSKPKLSKLKQATQQSRTTTSHQTGSVSVRVIRDDILDSNCQVLINTTGSNYNLSASMLSAKLIQRGGNTICNECQSNPVYSSNECRVTSGGSTQFQNIVHFVTPQVQHLSQSLETILQVIDQTLKRSSVAIPAIGTGAAKLPEDQVAQAFDKAISSFIAKNPTHLKQIDVVIFEQRFLATFQSNINSVSQASSSTTNFRNLASSSVHRTPKAKPRASNLSRVKALLESKNDSSHRVKVFFTSKSAANTQKAVEAIEDKAHKKCSSVHIVDEVLETLEDDEILELKVIEREFNVCIKVPTDEETENQFEIRGLKTQVTEAHKFVQNRLHKYNQAETLSNYVNWKYEDPAQPNNWIKFPLLNNLELQNKFKEDQTFADQMRVKMNGQYRNMRFDFSKMTISDNASTYKIKQVNKSSADVYPSNWSLTVQQHCQLVKLIPQSHSNEYQTIIQKFVSGGLALNQRHTIVRLERVEHKRQYKQFIAQKQDVEKRMNSKTVTKKLFHGTSSDICDQIYRSGFDRNYAGKNATIYGSGVYFAVTSQYSHNYTVPNRQGHRKMFLAEVITGQFTQGNRGMRVPPALPNSTDLHDSVVDNMRNPTMYVVFKDASVYPLYILTYI